ncbi:uncharacterized protein LOC120353961 [Nilaparvata lugens]|uniref:uncharacterized protein LOC120353961 n=1 Tax=Nilaparvata lugens TaxID=108931 RepID=UPI00193E3F63|nr:uncharacterized protein LOC120353961 [Nilaparvata lugens]
MSPRLQVPTLQECSLRYALTVIREGTFMCKGASMIKDERQYLIRVLHSGIRQQLINLAFHECRRDSNLMIEIVYLLLDGSIRCIAPTPEMEHLSTSQCMRLFCIMHQADATGLTELKITVNPRMKVAVEHTGMAPLNSLMSRGLARNLHTLVLRNTCDNAMLAQLGRHATCLSKLDIADNWLINEQGICQLLFKDSSSIHLPADLDDCDWMLTDLNRMPQDNLTRCCETLQEIRIQDTNTSGISVLMLLMFVKHLESLGGFLYYRNLGDCILAVKPFRSRLAITKLWDMHLPWEKMVAIGEVIGHGLHTLYTRVSQITAKQLPFTALRDLTIDFDYFVYEQAFVDFLATNGAQLTRLVLLDQGYNMDITVIANYCPQLVELAASTCLDNHFPHSELAHLKVARLKINTAQVFTWIMVNCPIIKKLAVRIEQRRDV